MHHKRNRKEKRKVNKKLLFIVELILAILLAIGCSLIGMSNFLWVSNDYWVTNSIMLTYKIFCASVMVIGGLGVWTFCYKKIGRVCGLVGIIAFCLQPLLLASFYREGFIAQGQMIAIIPWFLLLILSSVKKPTRGKFVGITILVALLILSHAMHAFMICLTTMIVLLIFILIKKITIKDFLITMSSIVFAGLFTAFWSRVGATRIENPGILYWLPETVEFITANLEWFIPNGKNAFCYYSIVVTALSALGIITYLLSIRMKRKNENHRFYVLACLLLTIITTIFSFGMQLPGFGFLPFSSDMVPGRILTFTAVTGAISCAYAIYMIWSLPKVKILLRPLTIGLVVLMCIEMNPFDNTYQSITSEAFDLRKEVARNKENAFDYMTDSRNALIISPVTQGFGVEFPNLVQGKSENLWDYTEAELMKYELIYIIEPVIRTQSQKDEFETMVTKLVNSGVTVMIEPIPSKTFELFDVHIEDELFDTSPVFTTTAECPYSLQNVDIKNNSNLLVILGLYGLDEVYANFELKNGRIKNAVLGTKNVGNGKVIFLGANLSQYLNTVYAHNNGIEALNDTVESNSDAIASIYSILFSFYGVNENYHPTVFNTVKEQHWDYKGGRFTYQSEAAQEVSISVTYTTRWKATLDGEEIYVGQRENLITLMLPAGEHTVDIHYGLTIYGKIGYVISAIGLILFHLILLFWNWIMKYLEKMRIVFRAYLQMEDNREQVIVPSKQDLSIRSATAEGESATALDLLPTKDSGLVKQDNSKMEADSDVTGKSEECSVEGNIIDAPIFNEIFNENGVKVEIVEIDGDNNFEVEEITQEVDQVTIDEAKNTIEEKQKKIKPPLQQKNPLQKRLVEKTSSKKRFSNEYLLKDLLINETSPRKQQKQKRKAAAHTAKLRRKNQNRYIKLLAKNK